MRNLFIKLMLILTTGQTCTLLSTTVSATECNQVLESSPVHLQNIEVILNSSFNRSAKAARLSNRRLANIYKLLISNKDIEPYMLEEIVERLVKKRVYDSSRINDFRQNHQIDVERFPYFIISNYQWVIVFNPFTKESSFREID